MHRFVERFISNYASDPAPLTEEFLANYVRRVRDRRGLSQKELAERADLHLQSVGKIERGQTQRLKQKPKQNQQWL